jgi:hypothetical protein
MAVLAGAAALPLAARAQQPRDPGGPVPARSRRRSQGQTSRQVGHALTPSCGVRPCRWTASCCGFDQALGVLILKVDGTAVTKR